MRQRGTHGNPGGEGRHEAHPLRLIPVHQSLQMPLGIRVAPAVGIIEVDQRQGGGAGPIGRGRHIESKPQVCLRAVNLEQPVGPDGERTPITQFVAPKRSDTAEQPNGENQPRAGAFRERNGAHCHRTFVSAAARKS